MITVIRNGIIFLIYFLLYAVIPLSSYKNCQVNENVKPPMGSQFLGYIYHEIMRLTESDYITLLLYILKRCCHVYFRYTILIQLFQFGMIISILFIGIYRNGFIMVS